MPNGGTHKEMGLVNAAMSEADMLRHENRCLREQIQIIEGINGGWQSLQTKTQQALDKVRCDRDFWARDASEIRERLKFCCSRNDQLVHDNNEFRQRANKLGEELIQAKAALRSETAKKAQPNALSIARDVFFTIVADADLQDDPDETGMFYYFKHRIPESTLEELAEALGVKKTSYGQCIGDAIRQAIDEEMKAEEELTRNP